MILTLDECSYDIDTLNKFLQLKVVEIDKQGRNSFEQISIKFLFQEADPNHHIAFGLSVFPDLWWK